MAHAFNTIILPMLSHDGAASVLSQLAVNADGDMPAGVQLRMHLTTQPSYWSLTIHSYAKNWNTFVRNLRGHPSAIFR